jgi:hypothetical protein
MSVNQIGKQQIARVKPRMVQVYALEMRITDLYSDEGMLMKYSLSANSAFAAAFSNTYGNEPMPTLMAGSNSNFLLSIIQAATK